MTLYVFDRPVHGRGAFLGRESLVRSLFDGFHMQRSFAVAGGPQTGRTSLLNHLEWLVRERWVRQPTTAKVVPARLDFADITRGPVRGVPEYLWNQISAAVRDPNVSGDTPPKDLPRADFKRTKEPWTHLIDLASETWGKLKGTQSWAEYGLFIDNADLLFSVRALEPVQQPFADFINADADWSPASVVAAGGRWLREHLLDEQALFASFRLMFLGGFKEPEALKLIRAGLPDAEEHLVSGLLAATGKHPYALQRTLAELEHRGESIGVEGAIDGAARDCLVLFEKVWAEFDMDRGVTYRGAYAAPEHALMQLLNEFGYHGCDIKTAERELGIQPLREYAEFLEYCGVAERAMVANAMHLRSHFDLFNVWYGERVMR